MGQGNLPIRAQFAQEVHKVNALADRLLSGDILRILSIIAVVTVASCGGSSAARPLPPTEPVGAQARNSQRSSSAIGVTAEPSNPAAPPADVTPCIEDDVEACSDALAQACDGGDAPSCTNLSRVLDRIGPELDLARSASTAERACSGGDADGCTRFGRALESGRGVTADPSRAEQLYEQACDRGSASGCRRLGVLYSVGVSTRTDERSRDLFRRACSGGDLSGCVYLGWRLQRDEIPRGEREYCPSGERLCDLRDRRRHVGDVLERACASGAGQACLSVAGTLEYEFREAFTRAECYSGDGETSSRTLNACQQRTLSRAGFSRSDDDDRPQRRTASSAAPTPPALVFDRLCAGQSPWTCVADFRARGVRLLEGACTLGDAEQCVLLAYALRGLSTDEFPNHNQSADTALARACDAGEMDACRELAYQPDRNTSNGCTMGDDLRGSIADATAIYRRGCLAGNTLACSEVTACQDEERRRSLEAEQQRRAAAQSEHAAAERQRGAVQAGQARRAQCVAQCMQRPRATAEVCGRVCR